MSVCVGGRGGDEERGGREGEKVRRGEERDGGIEGKMGKGKEAEVIGICTRGSSFMLVFALLLQFKVLLLRMLKIVKPANKVNYGYVSGVTSTLQV